MRRFGLVLALVCMIFGAAAAERPFLVNDFRDGDISDWRGGQLVGETLWVEDLVVKVLHQDWSGYSQLNLVFDEPVQASIELLDADQETWSAHGSGRHIQIPFSEFELISPTEDGWLSTGFLRELRLQVSQGVALQEIFLTGSKGFDGPTAYLSVTFDSYKGKSWEKVAQEIQRQGFTGIHLTTEGLTPSTYHLQHEIVGAFHDAGIVVALTIYPGTDFWAYQRYPQWRQEFLAGGSAHDWRNYLCLREEEYIQYTEEFVRTHMREYGYDALQMSEPWLEVWGGATRPQYYSCFCHRCTEAFKEISGVDPRVLFNDPQSETYYKTNDALYQMWIEFRVDTVMTFVERITQAVREETPEAKVFVMYLSDVTVDPGKTREYHGMDMDRMSAIRPDAIIIETAWQDWCRPELSPDYVITYGREYLPWVYSLGSGIKVYSQPDVGSNWDIMHRSPEWLRQFSANSYRVGFDGYVVYEYGLMGYRLNPAPEIVLDDFEKDEAISLYTFSHGVADEVIFGRVRRDPYEGEGALMLMYTMGWDGEGPLGVERRVQLNLSSFQGIRWAMEWGGMFYPGDEVPVRVELVTANGVLASQKRIQVEEGWMDVEIPLPQGDLTQVRGIRFLLEREEGLPTTGTLRMDHIRFHTERAYAIEKATLPLRHSTQAILFNWEIEDLQVQVLETHVYGEDRLLNLEIVLANGRRSLLGMQMDLVLSDGREQGKWATSVPITRVPRDETQSFLTDLIAPPGEYTLKVFIYPRGASPYQPQGRYELQIPLVIP